MTDRPLESHISSRVGESDAWLELHAVVDIGALLTVSILTVERDLRTALAEATDLHINLILAKLVLARSTGLLPPVQAKTGYVVAFDVPPKEPE